MRRQTCSENKETINRSSRHGFGLVYMIVSQILPGLFECWSGLALVYVIASLAMPGFLLIAFLTG